MPSTTLAGFLLFFMASVAVPQTTTSGVADSLKSAEERPEVPPPPFSEGIFPCSECHAGMELNRTRRQLTEFHTDIELKHDEQHRWCLDCHDAAERDSLHLASGERISFDESYRLCGQCHGEKLRDWRAGFTEGGPGSGTATSSICFARTATTLINRASARSSPSRRPGLHSDRADRSVRCRRRRGNRGQVTRRGFLTWSAAAAAGWILTSCGPRRLLDAPCPRLLLALRELEREYSKAYGTEVTVSDTPALPGVLFGYALDISRCIGCRRCVYACVAENNQSRDPQVHWIRVLSMEKERGGRPLPCRPRPQSTRGAGGRALLRPVACQQCRNAPCTKVCPTKATYTEPDGIVVIDYDWCIGCRTAWPLAPTARATSTGRNRQFPEDELNPQMHVLGNRPRTKGVVEKCTFCIQRTRNGRYPACVESVRSGPGSSATFSILKARSVTSSSTSGSSY